MLKYEIVTNTEEETKQIAERIAKQLKAGDVLTLEGNLGVGKTTFTKGIALGLHIERAVTSPTFTIVKQYEGTLPLYHMDAYRLENSDEDIGFDEYFYGDGISIIEWPNFIQDYLPKERLTIKIDYLNETKRKIIFIPSNDYYKAIVEQAIKTTK